MYLNSCLSHLGLFVFGLFLRRKNVLGLGLLACSAVIFRHELLALVVANVAMHAGFKLKNCGVGVKTVVISVFIGAILSTFVDSYFWGYWLIPEWAVFKYNVLEGKSAIYGVHDFFFLIFRHHLGIGTFLMDFFDLSRYPFCCPCLASSGRFLAGR